MIIVKYSTKLHYSKAYQSSLTITHSMMSNDEERLERLTSFLRSIPMPLNNVTVVHGRHGATEEMISDAMRLAGHTNRILFFTSDHPRVRQLMSVGDIAFLYMETPRNGDDRIIRQDRNDRITVSLPATTSTTTTTTTTTTESA